MAPSTDDFLPPRSTPGKACSPESLAEVEDFAVWLKALLTSDCEDDVPTDIVSLTAFVNEISVNTPSEVEPVPGPVEETPYERSGN